MDIINKLENKIQNKPTFIDDENKIKWWIFNLIKTKIYLKLKKKNNIFW